MAKNTLVINCDIGETRVALIENGILSELHVERRGQKGIVGNIYLGKVSRVLPGMQAAFIDIGEERAAFLHVEDLIRPADFEAYMAGNKGREPREMRGVRSTLQAAEAGDDEQLVSPEAAREAGGDLDADDDAVDSSEGDDDDDTERTSDPGEDTRASDEPAPVVEPDAPVLREAREEGEVIKKGVTKDVADMATRRGRRRRGGSGSRTGVKKKAIDADADAEADAPEEGAAAAQGAGEDDVTDEAKPTLPPKPRRRAADAAPPIDDPIAPPPPPVAHIDSAPPPSDGDRPTPLLPNAIASATSVLPSFPKESDEAFAIRELGLRSDAGRARPDNDRGHDRGRGRRGRGRDRGRGNDRGHDNRGGGAPGGGGGGGGGGSQDRSRRESRDGGLRLQRSTPINEVVKEGQEVIVQVTKDPLGTKGARVSSHVSLPGRYVVYMPTVEHVGVSRRIGNDIERRRLREAIEAMKPPQGGLIVRTVAEGLTKKQLKADVGYLVRLWGEIAKKKEQGTKAPTLLFQELDVVLRTARDMFTDDVEKIVIDDREQYLRLLRFIEMFMPERAAQIELYSGDEPIFDAYGLEDEIARALSRKVPLQSGGYLIIDQAEALTAIDVNSGRFVGKGNRDPEDTILQTNLEAVSEIAYQLRFRNIGGLIVLDLIDMERHSNREKVYRALEQALLADKAKTSINRISELGLVEMTRKRTRESLGRTLHEACFYCDGTGQLQSRATIAFEILRQIRRERQTLSGYKVIVNAHPSVIDLLKTDERETLKEAEKRYQRQIMLVPHREYHIEQFDLSGS